MKQLTHSLLPIIFLLSSCVSFDPTRIYQHTANSVKLSGYTVQWEGRSVQSGDVLKQLSEERVQKKLLGGGWTVTLTRTPDFLMVSGILETFSNFDIDIQDKSNGIINLQIEKMDITSNPLWLISSLLTAFLINFTGYPLYSYTASTQIRATLINNQGEKLQSVVGEGRGRAYSAMYWGYTWEGTNEKNPQVRRAAVIEAITHSLNDIKIQFNNYKK